MAPSIFPGGHTAYFRPTEIFSHNNSTRYKAYRSKQQTHGPLEGMARQGTYTGARFLPRPAPSPIHPAKMRRTRIGLPDETCVKLTALLFTNQWMSSIYKCNQARCWLLKFCPNGTLLSNGGTAKKTFPIVAEPQTIILLGTNPPSGVSLFRNALLWPAHERFVLDCRQLSSLPSRPKKTNEEHYHQAAGQQPTTTTAKSATSTASSRLPPHRSSNPRRRTSR
jgi:hypothetical protein